MKFADAFTVAGPAFVTLTSACGVTVVVTGGVILFVGLGSLVGVPTVATFVRLVPLAGAVTVSVRFVLVPAARLPRFVHKIAPPLGVPPPVAFTKFRPTGRLSVTDNDTAVEGPAFVTVIV